VIEPALARGEHVLCDRFTDSTRAYQGEGRGIERLLVDQVDRVATAGRAPDRTLLFDLPAELARERGADGRGPRPRPTGWTPRSSASTGGCGRDSSASPGPSRSASG
jgi:thymidylate kinase